MIAFTRSFICVRARYCSGHAHTYSSDITKKDMN
jgi:hypothetical protein